MTQHLPIPEPYLLQSYIYDLPEERIAREPAPRREASRLLVVPKGGDPVFAEHIFAELPRLLPPGALLVRNDTAVLPARLLATKPTGGKCEFLLLTPLPSIRPQEEKDLCVAEAEGLVRGLKPGQEMDFHGLRVMVRTRLEFGRCHVRLAWRGDLAEIFLRHGHMPLPPYIARPDTHEDWERYQTVYADRAKLGAVAAPTAGLHFTPEIFQSLRQRGVETVNVTLYVGYGTFSPVRVADIRQHRMHAEYAKVSPEAAQALARAKESGRPIIAVGTTSARVLESLPIRAGGIHPWEGTTDLYILPGHSFQIVDGLVTNFHLPGSSLLIMVAALAGLPTIRAAYAQAIQSGFRFFSYGDAMLIV